MDNDTSCPKVTETQELPIVLRGSGRRIGEHRKSIAYLRPQCLAAQGGVSVPIPLTNDVHIVGRRGSNEAHTQVDDPLVSRRHFEIHRDRDEWLLIDPGSKNHTYVNGAVVLSKDAIPLKDRAVIRLGGTLFVFRNAPMPTGHDEWREAMPGCAPEMVEVRRLLTRLAPMDIPILVLGETGTGKEYAARLLHAASDRSEGRFVAVNCAELSKTMSRAELFGYVKGAFTDAKQSRAGLVAEAAGGTLFLDEIGELSLDVQSELLRFLQEGIYRQLGGTIDLESSARIVAATHVDLDKAVEVGRFRQDLLARLRARIPPVRLPPLRVRREDILDWVRHFMAKDAPRMRQVPVPITPEFAEEVLCLDWRDNLRGLRSRVAEGLLMAPDQSTPRLNTRGLPEIKWIDEDTNREPLRSSRPASEIQMGAVIDALVAEHGVVQRAAKRLGISRWRLYRLCKRWGICVDDYR